ncbi:glycosyl hydrolase family 28-related protein [Brevundimonas mediterranea]|uniref:Rhamnogalacturonase A/B/Epimerase-like pectate lyase domain-containing protein n=1 Tax=Brevundimonas mediterranea TaxID=74329 RepID=A0A7Z8Y2K8_9CAUL|nr:glycosyl hydrolase family 28-related protein [Brevundimonas mediterranea]VDC49719.1 hypothetical protein BREV_BREV_01365 [Brevundimonas mediterranea]
MADAVVRVQSNRAVITLGGGEIVGFQAAQAAAPFADRAEAALAQIEEIAADAPDAPSVFAKADRYANLSDLTDPAAARFNIGADLAQNVNYDLGAPGSSVRAISSKAAERVSVKDFGTRGDNETDDTAAINAAIAWCNDQTFPVDLQFPRGFYRITGALTPITGPLRLLGCGPRNSVLNFFGGSYDCLSYIGAGSGARCANGGMEDMGLFCGGMSGGLAIRLDYTKSLVFRNILCDQPWDFVSMQQASDTLFDYIDSQPIRGSYGIHWFSGNGPRKGEAVDKSDILILRDVLLHGTNATGSGATAEGVVMDGWVHSLSIQNVKLLALARGLRASNSSGAARDPSFINGSGLEIENSYLENVKFDAVNGVWVNGIFAVGSTSETGMVFGPNARQIHLHGGRIQGNWKSGLDTEADVVSLTGMAIFQNSQFDSDALPGVRVLGGETIQIIGGLSGKNAGEPAYTEKQKFGIWNVGGSKVSAVGVDLTGNVSGGLSGTISATACFN